MITMTENEVLKNLEDELSILKRLIKSGENAINIPHANKGVRDYASKNAEILLKYYIKRKEVYEIVISDIKEAQQYREIGTVEECREAVEKQRTKKIIIRDWNPTKCPTCGHELSTSLGDGYYKHPTFLKRCPKCGRMIRWSEDLEGMEDE